MYQFNIEKAPPNLVDASVDFMVELAWQSHRRWGGAEFNMTWHMFLMRRFFDMKFFRLTLCVHRGLADNRELQPPHEARSCETVLVDSVSYIPLTKHEAATKPFSLPIMKDSNCFVSYEKRMRPDCMCG